MENKTEISTDEFADKIISTIQTALLKHLFPMTHVNNYPSMAVPKAVIVDMKPLVKLELTNLIKSVELKNV